MKIISFTKLRKVTVKVTAEIDDLSKKGERKNKSEIVSYYLADCETPKAIEVALEQVGDLNQIFFDSWDRRKSLNPVLISKEVFEVTSNPQISAGVTIYLPNGV